MTGDGVNLAWRKKRALELLDRGEAAEASSGRAEVRDIIRWEAPSERKRATGRYDWSRVAEALQQRPGQWALVYETDGSDAEAERGKGLAASIRTGNIAAFLPREAFEAAYRRVDGKTHVFARAVLS